MSENGGDTGCEAENGDGRKAHCGKGGGGVRRGGEGRGRENGIVRGGGGSVRIEKEKKRGGRYHTR